MITCEPEEFIRLCDRRGDELGKAFQLVVKAALAFRAEDYQRTAALVGRVPRTDEEKQQHERLLREYNAALEALAVAAAKANVVMPRLGLDEICRGRS